ncbi:acyl-CoA N-acyltransferase, partial [Lyophyllum atratum]
HVKSRREKEVYVHYVNTDKRMDEWVPNDTVTLAAPPPLPAPSANGIEPSKKRKRGRPPREYSARPSPVPPAAHPSRSAAAAASSPDAATVAMTEEEYDIQHHKQITAQRNFDKVHFGEWQVKTWYFSPYPLTDTEIDEPPPAVPSTSTASPSLPHPHTPKIPGVQKATPRSHGRTSDLLAGGLGRNYVGGEKAMLWVCQQCFKYMADGNSYDLHVKYCTVDYPPGTRVYQRGAHSIWEVDGAKQKLYCQNLSLFGKLFIDVKTLFFDCDNFLFYILTDSTSKQDHILGFFSKEKVSYDDYNLACIMTLPPYQRKGYGMLMIEFSYELSRRAGKIGTPERPLSDLGLRSYLAYWVSTLIRFFRHVLSTLPPDTKRITTLGGFPGIMRSPSGDSEDAYYGNGNGVRKTKKKTKGWAGEVEDPNVDADDVPFIYIDDPIFTTQRPFETVQREDGGAVTHVSVRCTLADIARATNLRVEDAAFAMNEVGLLVAHARSRARVDGMDGFGGGGAGGTVAITRALVEQVARERNVKRPCMRMAFVRL